MTRAITTRIWQWLQLPMVCNLTNNCHPLKEAKDAAASLVANLFDGYDRVAIVTFNYTATLVTGSDGRPGGHGAELPSPMIFTCTTTWMR